MAIHSRIALNTMCLPGSPLESDLAFAVSNGYSRISIDPSKMETTGWDRGTEIIVKSGLEVATVVNSSWFTLDDPSTWLATQEQQLLLLDRAAALGAKSVYGITGPAGSLEWSEAAQAYVEAIAPVAARARQLGIALAVEPTIPLRININLALSLRDAVELAQLAGVWVCNDLYGCMGEAHLKETIHSSIRSTALVQVCDYVFGTLNTPNRAVPGDGDLHLKTILGWMVEAGYDGAFDLELNGPLIDEEGYYPAALRGAHVLTALLQEIGA
ncbi:MAG: TIM barrel protein [Actinomycetota bacterium]|nr:TIM barrel protein [Actinomycetota bacterium]